MSRRLGVLGGTFDPPHVGHLFAAYAAIESLGLDEVVLIPAHRQPLKQGVEMTPAADRLAMTRLLCEGEPRLRVDAVEVDRQGLSFTVDTMRGYREREPDAELFLLMGDDTAATLPQWREPTALAALVHVVVLTRGTPGNVLPPGFVAQRLDSRRVDVSATEIRARVGMGLPVRGFVTDAVAAYITAHRLYRSTNQ